jgi:hypothetical protein
VVRSKEGVETFFLGDLGHGKQLRIVGTLLRFYKDSEFHLSTLFRSSC